MVPRCIGWMDVGFKCLLKTQMSRLANAGGGATLYVREWTVYAPGRDWRNEQVEGQTSRAFLAY